MAILLPMNNKGVHKKLGFGLSFMLCLLLHTQVAEAQLPWIRYDSIKVITDDYELQNPWTGGLKNPQFSVIDIDGDGQKDLFVFERDYNGRIKIFINEGTSGEVAYTHAPQYEHLFPEMHNWCLLADYNCDGKEDIFTSVPAGIAVYRNTTENQVLSFQLSDPILLSQTSDGMAPLYVSPPDIPAITDVDNDGDIDILSFGVLGKYVKYHKNLSLEHYGHCDSLLFEEASSCWGYFSESSQDNSITLYDSCQDISVTGTREGRHAGSALLALDLNDNGLKDLLLGDISYNNTTALFNEGSLETASMLSVDTAYPSQTVGVNLSIFPAAYHLDVNNDSMKDLLISPNNPNDSENFENIWYYQNISEDARPRFELIQTNFLQDEMLDFGEGAAPVFFDANADGLQDLVVGNYGYFINSSNYESRLALLLNTGTEETPEFQLINRDYSNLSAFHFDGIYPALGDLDADGDQDLITGDNEGNLHYFVNTAGPGNAATFALAQPLYMDIDVGEFSTPQLVDVNRDGTLDLLVGEKGGTINYFENTGSHTEAFFNPSPTNDFFGGIDVMTECCGGHSTPFLTEDSLGNYQLYTGTETGLLYLFNHIEDNINGIFNKMDSLSLQSLRTTISLADLNHDGNQEMVFGSYAGGISLLKKGQPQWIDIPTMSLGESQIQIFPNPSSDEVTVSIGSKEKENFEAISILNTMGQVVVQEKAIGNKANIDVRILKPGVYFLQLKGHSSQIQRKIVIN